MMFSFRKRSASLPEEAVAQRPASRCLQVNIKASDDCRRAFDKLARVQGVSKADLFEDLVVERIAKLVNAGMKF